MASIQTGIALNDQLSGKLYGIIGALYDTVGAMDELHSSLSQPISSPVGDEMAGQLGRAESAAERLQEAIARLYPKIEDNEEGQEEHNEAIKQGAGAADSLMQKIAGVAAAYATMKSVQTIAGISDQIVQTRSRIDLMNDGLRSTDEVMDLIYASAQDARGSYADMAGVVARFGNNAKDAFSGTEEVVAFANLIQKQMTIAGASTQEAANAELQLSQALGSGVLRGDELNSIFEQAPNLIQSIADYMQVPIGEIRNMAQEGKLSADIVKAAVFADADSINEKFAEMPPTWSQAWTMMQNAALKAFEPVLQRINSVANSEMFQSFFDGAVNGMYLVADIVLGIFDLVGQVATFVADNWGAIEPIILGIVAALGLYYGMMLAVNVINGIAAAVQAVQTAASTAHAAAKMMEAGATFAATAAQYGFNAALMACPITWIILAVIALIAVIFAIAGAVAKATGAARSGFGIIMGVVFTAGAFIRNLVVGLINSLIAYVINFYNTSANFAAAFGVLFNHPVAAIKAVMLSLFNFIVGVVSKAAGMLDALFGSNLQGAVAKFQGKVQAQIDATIQNAGGEKAKTLNAADYQLERTKYSDAFQAGAKWGDGAADKFHSLGGLFKGGGGAGTLPNFAGIGGLQNAVQAGAGDAIAGSGLPGSSGSTAGNTEKIADSLADSKEDLKYLRDIAEQETINRFTTAEVKLEMVNHNTIQSDLDLDGIVSRMTDSAEEAIERIAEGVH